MAKKIQSSVKYNSIWWGIATFWSYNFYWCWH